MTSPLADGGGVTGADVARLPGPGPVSSTDAATAPAPTKIPSSATTTSHIGNPREDARASARGVGRGAGVAAVLGTEAGLDTAAAIVAASGVVTCDPRASIAPQDWQNVRVGELAIPQTVQRTRPAAASAAGVDLVTGSGAAAGAWAGGVGAWAWAGGGVGTGAGATGDAGLIGEAGGTASGSAGCPSHSRNAPHEPQNWSPGALANPHRRQRIGLGSGMRLTPDHEHEGEVEEAKGREARRDR